MITDILPSGARDSVVLLFPSLALGETVKWEDLVQREGLHYKKFTWQMRVYKNGKMDGPWLFYDENGQKNLIGNEIGTMVIHAR